MSTNDPGSPTPMDAADRPWRVILSELAGSIVIAGWTCFCVVLSWVIFLALNTVHLVLLFIGNVVCSALSLVACGGLVLGKIGFDLWVAFPSAYGHFVPRTFHRLFNPVLRAGDWLPPNDAQKARGLGTQTREQLGKMIDLCDDYRVRNAQAAEACAESRKLSAEANTVLSAATTTIERHERRLSRFKVFLGEIIDNASLPTDLGEQARDMLLSFGLREHIRNTSVTIPCATDIEGNLLHPLTPRDVSNFLRTQAMPIPAEQIRFARNSDRILELGLYSIQVTCEPGDEPVDLKLWVVPNAAPEASPATPPARDPSTVDDVPSET